MKIKLFVTCEIQYFELGIFSFNSYVYYLSRGFIASTRAFNLLICAFNLPTRVFNLPTRAFNHETRDFRLPTRGLEFVTREFELVTRVLLFHINIRNDCNWTRTHNHLVRKRTPCAIFRKTSNILITNY